MGRVLEDNDTPPFEMTPEKVKSWYETGTKLLRGHVSYAFARKNHDTWGVAT